MANIPFADIADLMNRLLDEAAEHRRRRPNLMADANAISTVKHEAARAPGHAPRAAA